MADTSATTPALTAESSPSSAGPSRSTSASSLPSLSGAQAAGMSSRPAPLSTPSSTSSTPSVSTPPPSSNGSQRRRAPLVAAARAHAIDLTGLSDSDDSPVPAAGPSGPSARRTAGPGRSALANGSTALNGGREDKVSDAFAPGDFEEEWKCGDSEEMTAHGPRGRVEGAHQRLPSPSHSHSHSPHPAFSSHPSHTPQTSDDDFTITSSTVAPRSDPMSNAARGGVFPSSSTIGTNLLAGPSALGMSQSANPNVTLSPSVPRSGFSTSGFNNSLGTSLANASEAAHRAGFASFARNGTSLGLGNNSLSNSFATTPSQSSWVGVPSLPPTPQPSSFLATPSAQVSNGTGNGDGSSSAPIDVDSMPARPIAPAMPQPNSKKAVCIGAFMSRAIMLYPNAAVEVGSTPPPGSRWTIINYKGAEMIHVKLRVSSRGGSGDWVYLPCSVAER